MINWKFDLDGCRKSMDELTDQNIALVQKVAILQEDIAEQDAVIKTLQERLKEYDAR